MRPGKACSTGGPMAYEPGRPDGPPFGLKGRTKGRSLPCSPWPSGEGGSAGDLGWRRLQGTAAHGVAVARSDVTDRWRCQSGGVASGEGKDRGKRRWFVGSGPPGWGKSPAGGGVGVPKVEVAGGMVKVGGFHSRGAGGGRPSDSESAPVRRREVSDGGISAADGSGDRSRWWRGSARWDLRLAACSGGDDGGRRQGRKETAERGDWVSRWRRRR